MKPVPSLCLKARQFSDFCINPCMHRIPLDKPVLMNPPVSFKMAHTIEPDPYGKTGRQRILQVVFCTIDKVVLVEMVSL